MSQHADAFVSLPRGLRVSVAAVPGGAPLDAVVRAVGKDHITLGMLDLPPESDSLVGLRAAIAAHVHGRRYELDASIVSVEKVPPALVVTMPVEARRQQRRNFYRLNVSIDARGWWAEGLDDSDPRHAFDEESGAIVHALSAVRLLDISGGGTLVRTREPVPIGALIRLEAALEAGATPVEFHSRVRTVHAEERTHAYRLNTEFEGIARRTQEQIVRFIFQQQTLLSRRRSA